jgi:hypothetical protein
MNMVLSTARRCLAVCLIGGTLVSCSTDPSPDTASRIPPSVSADSEHSNDPDPVHELSELAALASEQATEQPTLLLVVNETSHYVVLTSADNRSTASLEPGKSLQFASKRVCGWIPLTASTTNGRVLGEYTEPCRGQTWTITDPQDTSPSTEASASRPQAANAAVRRRAEALLRAAGVTSVLDTDGGDRVMLNASLSGVWRNRPVIAYVVPHRSVASVLAVVSTFVIGTTPIDVIAPEDSATRPLRFRIGPDDWLITVTRPDRIQSDDTRSRGLVCALLQSA